MDFCVRTIFAEGPRSEEYRFDLAPKDSRAQEVCRLFQEFLAQRPPEFRDVLPFLKRPDISIQWAAQQGGVAFATFFEGATAVSLGILLSGTSAESDDMMLRAFRETVLAPVFDEAADELMDSADRPLLLHVVFPGAPESGPLLQLLFTALASVFFRLILQLRDESKAAARPC